MEKLENKYDENIKEDLLNLKLALKAKANIADINEIVVSSLEKPVVGTIALATCYGIVFYDRKNKLAMVGHASPSNLINILKEMMQYFTIDSEATIEYVFVPGYVNDANKDYQGLRILEDYLIKNTPSGIKLIPFNGIELLTHEDIGSYDFAFDATDGKPVTKYLFYNEKEQDISLA